MGGAEQEVKMKQDGTGYQELSEPSEGISLVRL